MVREMLPGDIPRVMEIYAGAIEEGTSTFMTQCPPQTLWDAAHYKACRYVAMDGEALAGFTALSPISEKPFYYGVAEVMIYIDPAFQHRGHGTALLKRLLEDAPNRGFWCIYSAIYGTNQKSIALHEKCGFRRIGLRERLARDKFGNWMDIVQLEYRYPDEIVRGEH